LAASFALWLGRDVRHSIVSAAISLALIFAANRASATPSATSVEQGYDMGEIESPRWVAFGGAQSALGASTTAVYDNPANLASSRVYHFEGLVGFSPIANRQSYGGALVLNFHCDLRFRPQPRIAANADAAKCRPGWLSILTFTDCWSHP